MTAPCLTLKGRTNQTFQLTLDLSALAPIYDLTSATFRMAASSGLEWASDGSASGVIQFDPDTGWLFIGATASAAAALLEKQTYDLRAEFPGGFAIMVVSGLLLMASGVTQSATDITALPAPFAGSDTVTIAGYSASAPFPIPAPVVRTANFARYALTLDLSEPGWML